MPKLTLYYSTNDVDIYKVDFVPVQAPAENKTYQLAREFPLFSDPELTTKVGQRYCSSLITESTPFLIEQDTSSFRFLNGDSITYIAVNDYKFIPPGTTEVNKIVTGSGKYLLATGTVSISVRADNPSLRTVVIRYCIPPFPNV